MDIDSRTSPTEVTVEIDGVAWTRVLTFAHSGPEDRAFMATTDPASGATTVLFGDGVTGKRPPSSVTLVRAEYRSGSGSAGNVQAGSNDRPQKDPLRGLLAVIGEQVRLLAADLERLYDDWFVPTTGNWVIPYSPDDPAAGEWTFSRASDRWCLCLDRSRDRDPSAL
jgi:hypothetical protein